jgi:hypothetical protein
MSFLWRLPFCVGLPIAFAAQEPVVAPNVYVNCQWHVAAIFPGQPIIRDISYTDNGRTVSGAAILCRARSGPLQRDDRRFHQCWTGHR